MPAELVPVLPAAKITPPSLPRRDVADVAAAFRRSPSAALAAAVVGAGLVAATLLRYGASADGVAWACAQLLLAFVAWFDVLERRILNSVLFAATAAVLALRAVTHPHTLLACAVAAAVAFAVFLMFAVVARGGLGMGDVKLAALIGLLFGGAATYALLVGCVAGGVAAAALLLGGRSRRHTYAYGPYLVLGAAAWILVGSPPPLA